MVRLITEKDTGLKVLRNAPPETEVTQIIDIVAVHGLGAHPDDSWCKNIGTVEEPQWFNWLVEDSMLPAIVPHARIMRYGYQSEWFGKEAMQQSVSTVADRLLRALTRRRKDVAFRPLVFVAHCFGGLVVLKALQEAEQYQSEWPGVFRSTTGLVFFGTPFRGAEGMKQVEMLDAARREYNEDQIQPAVLEVLQPGNAYLKDLVDGFLKKMRGQVNKTQIVCFFELKSSNVGRIVGNQDRTRFVVNEHAGCLDLSESINKRSLSRTHFNMNKFGSAEEEDFELVAEVIEDMVNASPALLSVRSQYSGKHKIQFSLRGIPIVDHFVQRAAEMEQIERLLFDEPTVKKRRGVVVIHGLGGIGKTQLAVEFAREHHGRFSSVFWLDGSSKESLRKSFVDMVQRLPRTELTAEGVEMLRRSAIDIDKAIQECLRWLSLPTNKRWLIILDNVDRKFPNAEDPQAYVIETYIPDTDHGYVIITSRLARLQKQGLGIKVGTVGTEQARAMLESNAGRSIEDADIILDLLSGLPLALTQAGSYLQETNMSTSAYVKHYDSTWERLMQIQTRYPVQEYGDRNVLTTWTISYEHVQKQSDGAASLLKLWGFLDHGELWYELISAASEHLKNMCFHESLIEIAEDELAYAEAISLLSRYSLADAKEGSNSYSMHPVLHKWCRRLTQDDECYAFGWTAAAAVAQSLFSGMKFSTNYTRLLSHAVVVAKWLTDVLPTVKMELKHTNQPLISNLLGLLLSHEGQLVEADAMYERALQESDKTGADHWGINTLHGIAELRMQQGQLKEAEVMLERVLRGSERLGADVWMLRTMHSMAELCKRQGRLDEAETILKQVLQVLDNPEAEVPMLDSTFKSANHDKEKRRLDEAETMFDPVLRRQEKLPGLEHGAALETVYQLALVYLEQDELDKAESMFKRTIQEFENMMKPGNLSTNSTALGIMWVLGTICHRKKRVEEAKVWYTKAIAGFEDSIGPESAACQDIRNQLTLLNARQGEAHSQQDELPLQITSESTIASTNTPEASSNPERHMIPEHTERDATHSPPIELPINTTSDTTPPTITPQPKSTSKRQRFFNKFKRKDR